MKKVFLILTGCAIVFQSCSPRNCKSADQETKTETTTVVETKETATHVESYIELTPPILVVAVAKETENTYSSIILKDANGEVLTLMGNTAEGNALAQSYNAGEYIK
ncbi:MAG: hypothetical protein WC979_00350 [Candidatus Pacearchaeota archaeon]|jgi:hypothetical protein|nr:hypothetical protein [Clostridia bacterium]